MNNILFSVIGFLLFAIAGIGVAEVKTQMRVSSGADISVASQQVEQANDAESSQSGDIAAEAPVPPVTEEPEDSVVSALKDAAQTVIAAYAPLPEATSVRSRHESEESENEWEDEYEDEDDDGEHSRSRSGTTTQTPPAQTTTPPSGTSQTTTTTSSGITMSIVAQHATAASCYSAINGSVYDLTSFVTKHPGGQSAIKSLCGKDGTAAFNAQHGGSGNVAQTLAGFKIGTLAQ